MKGILTIDQFSLQKKLPSQAALLRKYASSVQTVLYFFLLKDSITLSFLRKYACFN